MGESVAAEELAWCYQEALAASQQRFFHSLAGVANAPANPIVRPLEFIAVSGFRYPEKLAGKLAYWATQPYLLLLAENPTSQVVVLTMTCRLLPPPGADSTRIIDALAGATATSHEVNESGVECTFSCEVRPSGVASVLLSTAADPRRVATDDRDLYFRLDDPSTTISTGI